MRIARRQPNRSERQRRLTCNRALDLPSVTHTPTQNTTRMDKVFCVKQKEIFFARNDLFKNYDYADEQGMF
jgi:hypothetical protein